MYLWFRIVFDITYHLHCTTKGIYPSLLDQYGTKLNSGLYSTFRLHASGP